MKIVLKKNTFYKENRMFTSELVAEMSKACIQFSKAFKTMSKVCELYVEQQKQPTTCEPPVKKTEIPVQSTSDDDSDDEEKSKFSIDAFMESKGRHCYPESLKRNLVESLVKDDYRMDRCKNVWKKKKGKYKRVPLSEAIDLQARLNLALSTVQERIALAVQRKEDGNELKGLSASAYRKKRYMKIPQLVPFVFYKNESKDKKENPSLHQILEEKHLSLPPVR